MITFEEPVIGEDEKKYLYDAIDKDNVAQGPYVKKFEDIVSSYISVKYASACFNGTVALHVALAALGIKQGDEVIVPSFTFIAPANAAAYLGAKPVFADINENTLCIDPESIKDKINKNTKAIIPVHIYGNPCNMSIINEIAQKNGLYVIEDAAEAFGAKHNGKNVGSLSDIGCLSFQLNKIIRTGEGGMCLTNHNEIDNKLRLLRSQGKVKSEDLQGDDYIERRYCHKLLGFNYRMTDIQAAIGIPQVEKIEANITAREKIALLYDNEFKKYGIGSIEKDDLAEPIKWVYPLIFKDRGTKLKAGRELLKRNIPFLPFFWPCHKQPFYNTEERLPITESISEKGFSIPCNPLITENEAVELAKVIGNSIKNA